MGNKRKIHMRWKFPLFGKRKVSGNKQTLGRKKITQKLKLKKKGLLKCPLALMLLFARGQLEEAKYLLISANLLLQPFTEDFKEKIKKKVILY